jgi:hypothetical protein
MSPTREIKDNYKKCLNIGATDSDFELLQTYEFDSFYKKYCNGKGKVLRLSKEFYESYENNIGKPPHHTLIYNVIKVSVIDRVIKGHFKDLKRKKLAEAGELEDITNLFSGALTDLFYIKFYIKEHFSGMIIGNSP